MLFVPLAATGPEGVGPEGPPTVAAADFFEEASAATPSAALAADGPDGPFTAAATGAAAAAIAAGTEVDAAVAGASAGAVRSARRPTRSSAADTITPATRCSRRSAQASARPCPESIRMPAIFNSGDQPARSARTAPA
ncbi:DUF6053 domain-containing protein [Lysobacter enzymogenes]|uniref:DUF6053 domain-containing protein n=1 Tax=Lysobacter enzymogenes TaxID=69 RepID=UPI003749024C